MKKLLFSITIAAFTIASGVAQTADKSASAAPKKTKQPNPEKLLNQEVKFYKENRKEVFANAPKSEKSKEQKAKAKAKKASEAKQTNKSAAPVTNMPPGEQTKKFKPSKDKKDKKVKEAKVKKEKAVKAEKPAKVKKEKSVAAPKVQTAPVDDKTIRLENLKKSQPKQ